jgi:hypothetical protein
MISGWNGTGDTSLLGIGFAVAGDGFALDSVDGDESGMWNSFGD